MNRRDSGIRTPQPGGQQDHEGRWDMPRQAGQWQDGPARQAGGNWEDDDFGRASARGLATDGSYSAGMSANPDPGYGERGDTGGEARYRRGREAGAAYRTGASSGQGGAYPIHNFDAGSGNRYADFTSEDYGGRDFYASRPGYGGGLAPSNSYRPTFGFHRNEGYRRDEYGDWREYGESRGFLKRAGDEIASWFGDEEAAHRRELDHRGRGPSDYTRSDERIREDVNDKLTNDWRLDASNVRVTVSDGEVTLDGTVGSRADKRRAEDLADDISGVGHVQNNLRINPETA